MRRFKILLAGLITVAAIIGPASAYADVNNFVVTNFLADETLTNSDRQGELHIVERINVAFTDQNHGILRAIPNMYHDDSLQLHVNGVSSESGAPTRYTTYDSNDNTVLKIGDPNRTVTGPQEYTIDYTVRNIITFYKDHDELYWNVNGTQWQQYFQHVSVILHLPSGLEQIRQPVCYAGAYGGTGQACTINGKGTMIEASANSVLAPGQTLTYAASFKPGYFKPANWYERLGEYAAPILKFFVPIVILGGGSFAYWWRRGRDPRGKGVIIPEYEAPDGLKPIQVGSIVHFDVANHDITATIIDLAVRGYIKIIETKQKKTLRKDTLSYTVEVVNDKLDDLEPYETSILNALFASQVTVGRQVDISNVKLNFAPTAAAVKKQIEDRLTRDGYFRGNPLGAGGSLGVAAVTLILIIIFFGKFIGFAAAAGCFIGAAIALAFATKLSARTAKGVTVKEKALGLKLYLEFAEKDRINKLQVPDAPYAPSVDEPKKTVDLFEKLLPYAMVLNVEKQWANQFKDLYKAEPDWYSGNWSAFNAYYLASNLDAGFGAAVNTAFSAPQSSSSSGFGGGFSGGGGGGGGGGGW